MENEADKASTRTAVAAFQGAWESAIRDYAKRRINSEHCLQAAIYRGMRRRLSKQFTVYASAVVRLSTSAKAEAPKTRVFLDLVVCHEEGDVRTIVAGIELKFAPRRGPSLKSTAKDVMSLSHLSKRKTKAERVKIEMTRYRGNTPAPTFAISQQRKLLLGVFCADTFVGLAKKTFWKFHRPARGLWKGRAQRPANLGVALAMASKDGPASSVYYGRPFKDFARA